MNHTLRRVRVLGAGLLLGLMSWPLAAALPTAVADGGYPWQLVGNGELSWFGFSIYDASLWTVDGRFSGFVPGRPVALSLWYKRAFTRDELLDITSRAWHKLGAGSEEQRAAWLARLAAIWTDVAPGDNQTTVVVPGSASRFYDQNGLLGTIDDPAFGPAFLSIWLDHQSVVGELRAQLLGLE